MIQPDCWRPCANAARRAWPSGSSEERAISTPMRRILSRCCCAFATTGHAATPPNPAMNSRRRIHFLPKRARLPRLPSAFISLVAAGSPTVCFPNCRRSIKQVGACAEECRNWEARNGLGITTAFGALKHGRPSRPSGPGLLEWVVLILVARFSTELPAMVVGRHRIGECQGQGIGKIG